MLAFIAILSLSQSVLPDDTIYGEWRMIANSYKGKSAISPKASIYHFSHNGDFSMKANGGKKPYIVKGKFKIGGAEDFGSYRGYRMEFMALVDNGKRVPNPEMGETSFIWFPKLHSITDLSVICYAKEGYEKQVLKLLAGSKIKK